jgi:ChaB
MFNEKTEMPSTLKDSPPEAKRAFMKTYDRAVELYGEGERARRTAFAALKCFTLRDVTRCRSGNWRGLLLESNRNVTHPLFEVQPIRLTTEHRD